jgi:hypothetical protein
MQITSIERHDGSGMWHGSAIAGDKKYLWYYRPRGMFRISEEEGSIPNCWINIEPVPKVRSAVLKAIRASRAK